MTEKLKCPFCGTELENELNFWDKPTDNYFCPNEKCKIHYKSTPESVWELAISAKKAQDALDYAISVLANLTDIGGVDMEIIKIKEMAGIK